jgi:hypothetical protein
VYTHFVVGEEDSTQITTWTGDNIDCDWVQANFPYHVRSCWFKTIIRMQNSATKAKCAAYWASRSGAIQSGVARSGTEARCKQHGSHQHCQKSRQMVYSLYYVGNKQAFSIAQRE